MLRVPHNDDKLAIADALKNIHFYNAIATTIDVTLKYADIYGWIITFKNRSKELHRNCGDDCWQ
ncbi:MAG: hypothetical protein QXL69_00550 [Candidatus Bathyarchaeia archaeon]